MGEITKIYNSSIEIGIRVLLILRNMPNNHLSTPKLMIIDYLALNTFDVGGPPSLHAPIPNRGVQVFSRKKIVDSSIQLLLSKELITVLSSDRGFLFRITENGVAYLQFFESKYFNELRSRIEWATTRFGHYSDKELNLFVKANVPNWGTEFLANDNQIK